MRIVFCGTPEFAVPALQTLLSDARFEVAAVVSQPDRPRGRGQQVFAPPVKELAIASGIKVYQPEKIRSAETHEFFVQVAPDAVVIIAYGQIIPASLIALPRLGWINLHGSLLPKYRGAAPIAWAIANGETVTGVTTMQIDAGMDTGPILQQRQITIGHDETAPQLARRMAEAGASLVAETLVALDAGRDCCQAAGKLAGDLRTAAQKRARAYRLVACGPGDLQSHPRIRALAGRLYNVPRPALPNLGPPGNNRRKSAQRRRRCRDRLRYFRASFPAALIATSDTLYAACGHDSRLALDALQLQGRKRITAREFINGVRPQAGEHFE